MEAMEGDGELAGEIGRAGAAACTLRVLGCNDATLRTGSLDAGMGEDGDWLARSRSRYISMRVAVLEGCGEGVCTGGIRSVGGCTGSNAI